MDWKEWDELLRVGDRATRANPACPHNAHFYEARNERELRIFDVYCAQSGIITIGECLPPGRLPLKAPLVGRDYGLYSHVTYGGVQSQSPDEVMSAFAADHGLTRVKKFAEINTKDEMDRMVLECLRRLGAVQ